MSLRRRLPLASAEAGVPIAERTFATKPGLALQLLDQARAEGVPRAGVVADAGDGPSAELRAGLEARGGRDAAEAARSSLWKRPTVTIRA